MRLPRSTYRLQLNAEFRLADVHGLLDYFQALGISDLYLSPLLQARPGSTHGYDVTDPGLVNPELGTDDDFDRLAEAASARGLGILLDIVPNHMSATEANPWFRDVMEFGAASSFAHFFDIDWTSQTAGAGKLLLPFLGQPLEQCLAEQQIRVVCQHGDVGIAYADRVLPIDAACIPALVRALYEGATEPLPHDLRTELDAIAADATALPERTAARNGGWRQQARQLKNRLARALADSSGDPLRVIAPERLRELLELQPYTLFYWVPGGRQINYRRFFDISDLAGVRTEDPDVFLAVHQRVTPWLIQGTLSGVRIDHIDGLRDPAAYLERLDAEVVAGTGERPYVVVEKILLGDERLRPEWRTAGTTGYDFIGTLNGLFVQPEGWEKLRADWAERTGAADFTTLVHEKKRQVVNNLFAGEFNSLVQQLHGLLPDAPAAALGFALAEVTAALPVYRTYVAGSVSAEDRAVLEQALDSAGRRGADDIVLTWLRAVLLQPAGPAQLDFLQRWQQFTGPVMAKGLEDTAFYNYHPLISTCEVGADPRHAVCTAGQFHERMVERQAAWRGTLNASSTHDTKRSEDVRARINVLSECADEWLAGLACWQELHAAARQQVEGLETPDPSDQLLFYQTLIGLWPLEAGPGPAFQERVCNFMLKAVREAKRRTSWRAQNEPFEAAIARFCSHVLEQQTDLAFQRSFGALQERTAFFGAINSLSQLVLKLGAPGVPDFYQGTELWSLHLVDPDNRAPVDYALRRSALWRQDLELARQNWQDGRIKARITAHGLRLRHTLPALFADGEYAPIVARGEHAHNIIAFERRRGRDRALFVVGRFFAGLTAPGIWPVGAVWGDTTLELETPARQDVLTGRLHERLVNPGLSELFSQLPCAILIAQD